MAPWLDRVIADSQHLLMAPDGASARQFLAARGIPLDVAEMAGVGWMPTSYNCTASADFIRWADYGNLRARVVFPFSTADGKYTGLQTRSLSDTVKGKDRYQTYLLPTLKGIETPMFNAMHAAPLLFGGERLQVVLVEGPMDALAVCAAGEQAVVAAHTAAIPAVTVEWIRRWSNSTVLALLDMDKPGRHGVEKLIAAGLTVAAPVYAAHDPSDLWRAFPGALRALVQPAHDDLAEALKGLL